MNLYGFNYIYLLKAKQSTLYIINEAGSYTLQSIHFDGGIT
jgi:hypothetical protein